MPIKLHYFKSSNFGDAMAPLVVERMAGRPVVWAPQSRAQLMAIGSVFYEGTHFFSSRAPLMTMAGVHQRVANGMGKFRPRLHVWGSGFLAYRRPLHPYLKRQVEIHAVRGSLTLSALQETCLIDAVAASGVALGDPGLLYAKLFQPHVEKRHDLGLIPHYHDRIAGEFLMNWISRKGIDVIMIDVSNPPEQVVSEVASCRSIASSSLHGLIVSDSLGVPNRQMQLSTLRLGDDDYFFKFRDYYSAYGREMPTPMTIMDMVERSETLPGFIASNYTLTLDEVDRVQCRLGDSFPKGV